MFLLSYLTYILGIPKRSLKIAKEGSSSFFTLCTHTPSPHYHTHKLTMSIKDQKVNQTKLNSLSVFYKKGSFFITSLYCQKANQTKTTTPNQIIILITSPLHFYHSSFTTPPPTKTVK